MEANRTITVSHWGNINIHDNLQLKNNGAEFLGEYNPILLPKFKPESMFHGVTIKLPEKTWGFSYRDEIGNVSSTIATREKQEVKIHIQPRFPLFGQWNATWEIEYNLPTENFINLNTENDLHTLNYSLSLPYSSIPARVLNLKVVLPEGSIIHDHELDSSQLTETNF